jgi:hypothetical protein
MNRHDAKSTKMNTGQNKKTDLVGESGLAPLAVWRMK